jgi:hypothetical protein
MNTLNRTSRSLRSSATRVLAGVVLMVSGVLAQACATSGGSSGGAPAASDGPVELDKSRWKLVALAGALDGRVVEFQKRGDDGYSGKLVDLGRRLRDVVGLDVGYEVFQLKRKKPNEYEGIYQAIDPKGGIMAKEVIVFINGNSMTWNQESAVWERQ